MSNVESVTQQLGLTEAAMTGLSVLDKILSIEYDKNIKRKVIIELILFKKNLCAHYIMMRSVPMTVIIS
jgi:hypothetical protein